MPQKIKTIGALSAAVVAEPGDKFTALFNTLGEVKVQFIK